MVSGNFLLSDSYDTGGLVFSVVMSLLLIIKYGVVYFFWCAPIFVKMFYGVGVFFLYAPLFIYKQGGFFMCFACPRVAVGCRFVDHVVKFFLCLPSVEELMFRIRCVGVIFLIVLTLFYSGKDNWHYS